MLGACIFSFTVDYTWSDRHCHPGGIVGNIMERVEEKEGFAEIKDGSATPSLRRFGSCSSWLGPMIWRCGVMRGVARWGFVARLELPDYCGLLNWATIATAALFGRPKHILNRWRLKLFAFQARKIVIGRMANWWFEYENGNKRHSSSLMRFAWLRRLRPDFSHWEFPYLLLELPLSRQRIIQRIYHSYNVRLLYSLWPKCQDSWFKTSPHYSFYLPGNFAR